MFLKTILPNFQRQNILQLFIKDYTVNGKYFTSLTIYILPTNKHLKIGKYFLKYILLQNKWSTVSSHFTKVLDGRHGENRQMPLSKKQYSILPHFPN